MDGPSKSLFFFLSLRLRLGYGVGRLSDCVHLGLNSAYCIHLIVNILNKRVFRPLLLCVFCLFFIAGRLERLKRERR